MNWGKFLIVFSCISSAWADKLEIANPELLTSFTSAGRNLLEKNYFFVASSDFDQIYDVYTTAKKTDTPILVTPDCILHTFHILVDYALRTTELEYFSKDLAALTRGLLDYELTAVNKPAPAGVTTALKNNVAFLAVGASLIDPDFKPPTAVKNLVAEELAKIEAHSGFDSSAIFNYKEDYSQYIPRGHYTRNEEFKRYFKAMMWFGRMGFYLQPGRQTGDIELGRRLTRQAILICDVLQNAVIGNKKAMALWERIYKPTVFFVGKTDDLNIYDYLPLIDSVFSREDIYQAIGNQDKLDRFIDKALALRPPRIVSTLVLDTLNPALVTKGLKFMGQRFIPDSYIFQQLVYDKVGTRSNPRLFPKGLDVMAVLGSARAFEILDRVDNETQFARYREQMTKLKDEFSKLTDKDYAENLYWGWLYTLKLLLKNPLGITIPRFMMTTAWPDKCLVSGLGSWAELRHDTILYAKQSYTLQVTGMPPRPRSLVGYVEPYPLVYSAIGDLVKRLTAVLSRFAILNPEVKDKLEALASLCASLTAISEKELNGVPLPEDALWLIRGIGDDLKGMTTFSQKFGEEFQSETDKKMAVIADVHTDPNTRQVLEAGVGNPSILYAVIPFDGKNYIAQGGVFSYYEFTHNMNERLTDEDWQALKPKPEEPGWVKSFAVKK
jgi:hypothetical protein